jgi:serine/threonine protein kinase/formylglycine-generating enzyme required for sulfatase activity
MKLKPERWQQIEKLYHAALERKESERARFLDEACAHDAKLRREVDSLLSSHEKAEGFLDSPALDMAARTIATEQSVSVIGTTIGHYKITAPLGSGGMGEVYLARDKRLGRQVALKLLPDYFTGDTDRVRRFEQEARAASALNHPNILTIYDIGKIEGIHFIATEYVEGETLRSLMQRKRMALDEILTLAIQLASALAAAHQAGIVHRDVKPENIMLRGDGIVKVLDFGLAKLTEHPSYAGDSEAPQVAAIDTNPGVMMGTVNYMSPEQARGIAVDTRTDIFSFGVVCYEMLASHSPFEGETPSDALALLLTAEPPPLSLYSPEVPRQLQSIIDKALRKDREKRYQTIKEMNADLKNLKQELEHEARKSRFAERESANEPTALSTTAQTTVAFKTAATQIRIDTSKDQPSGEKSGWKTRKNLLAVALVAALIVAAVAMLFYRRAANLRWAKDQVARIEEMARAQAFFDAYDVAAQVRKYLPEDQTIMRLMPTISDMLSVSTEPAGARVYLKRFSPGEGGGIQSRELVGTTPIANLQIARGDYLLEIEKDGYAKMERTISGALWPDGNAMMVPPPIRIEGNLIEAGKAPNRMEFIPGGDYRIVAWRRPTDARVRLDGFFIDKYEVTNQEYKEFINAGGYLKKQFWEHPFIKDGKPLSWEEAMRQMHDRTGLPGPRSWSNQNFPEGKAAHPVTDITWYEAAAYAAFRGKRLPTIFQWEKAARNGQSSFAGLTMPWGIFREKTDYRANFKGSGTMPADSLEFGMSPYGCYNMAGNAAEWCFNETTQGFITSGGSWEDPSYLFGYYGTYPAFFSSNKLGFRCVMNLPEASGDQGAMKIKIEDEVPTYTPASDQEVISWIKRYQYEKTPLDAQVIEVKETDEWRREKITYNGAGGERAIAYLYLPKIFQGPLQVIHIMPPGDVSNRARSLPDSLELQFSSFVKSGRAVFGVVLKGYIERDLPAGYKPPSPTTIEYVEQLASLFTDVRRGLDYLETRKEIAANKIAYFGPSGGNFKLILPAVETRYRSVVFTGAGVRKYNMQWKPEANAINFAPHIRAPKLMLHGRYDEADPFKTEGEPLFKLLREPKRLMLVEGGHIPDTQILIPAINGWLDETMGPIKRE